MQMITDMIKIKRSSILYLFTVQRQSLTYLIWRQLSQYYYKALYQRSYL